MYCSDFYYKNKLLAAFLKCAGCIPIAVKTKNNFFTFDKVIIATHSDQAACLIDDPLLHKQKELLQKIPYKKSEVFMHYDDSILPKKKNARASWNYYIDNSNMPTVTYNMNILQ
ncbi:MAG: hypothetical protein IIB81_02930 [Nanoarchaeota archaeon]|nr:hypothetical protein [Nanoarchaeota archaeon]